MFNTTNTQGNFTTIRIDINSEFVSNLRHFISPFLVSDFYHNSIYPIGCQYTGNNAPNIGTWEVIGLIGTGNIPTIDHGNRLNFAFNGRIICNGTNLCQVSFHVWCHAQNTIAQIDLFEYGLTAINQYGFTISEQIGNSTNMGNVRNHNVLLYYNNSNTQLVIDTNFGNTNKLLRYVLTVTCEITNYNSIRALSTNFVNVFRRST